tara:strand:- start:9 stop:287 length:279 start_codon:yes stop_codon:yes gene_type:complete
MKIDNMRRHPKDRGFGYKKSYDYDKSIKLKGYDYCVTVINSCETENQLNDAQNLTKNFLKINGDDSMAEYLFLQNMIFNKKLMLNYASGDTE